MIEICSADTPVATPEMYEGLLMLAFFGVFYLLIPPSVLG